MKKAAGYHPGPVTPSTANRLSSTFSVTRVSLDLIQLLSPDLDNREISRKSQLELIFCWNEMKTKKVAARDQKETFFVTSELKEKIFPSLRKNYSFSASTEIRVSGKDLQNCRIINFDFWMFDWNQPEGDIAQR